MLVVRGLFSSVFKRLKDFLISLSSLRNVCGMGNPRHEVRHSESGFRMEDVSPSSSVPSVVF